MINDAEILNLMQQHCNFVDEIAEDTFEKNIVLPLLQVMNFDYEFGATKLVIIPDDTSFVIKIPFSATITDNCYEPIIDYCSAEMDIYQHSETEKCENFFLPLELMGRINGYPIYKQEKAEIEENDTELLVLPMKETIWYQIAKETTNFENFSNFCRIERIEDLRAENLGYYNDVPVVIDYGGFIGGVFG